MNKSSNGVDILLFIFIVYSGLPVLSVYLPTFVNVLVTICVYVYVVLKLNNRFLSAFSCFLPLFAIDILYCIGSFIISEDNLLRDIYGILRAMLWPILALIIAQNNNKILARNALLLTLFVYSITAITTIYGCSLYSGASRLITDTYQDESYRNFLKSFNIGDYQFIYILALSTPVLLYFLRYRHLGPLLTLPIIALSFYTIYTAEFTTALMFSVFSLILIFVPKSHSVKSFLIISSIALVIILFSSTFFIDLLQSISGIIDSEVMSTRISEMSESLRGERLGDEADLAVRIDVWQSSWDAFMKNPLWGTYGKGGGHSLILDTIGDFGFLGILALIISFRSLYKLYVRPYARNDIYIYVSFMFLLTIAFSLFNTGVKFFVFSFIVPLSAYCYSKKLQ